MVRMLVLAATTGMLVPASLSGHPSVFTVTPSVSFLHLGGSFRTDAGFTYGVATELALSRKIDTWVSVHTASLHSSYDGPYGTDGAPLGLLLVSAGARYTLNDPDEAFGLSISVGAGFGRFSSEARVVPAGALGSLRLPARTDTRGIGTLGAGLNLRVSRAVSFRLEPAVMVFTPLDAAQGNFSITGGLRVAIF